MTKEHDFTNQNTDATLADACRSTNRVLQHAIKHGLDLTVISSYLRKSLRNNLYLQINGHTFADQLRKILENGRIVRLLVWNTPTPDLIDDDILDLVATYGPTPANENALDQDQGLLDIRIAGEIDHSSIILQHHTTHDLSDPDNFDNVLSRIELPHRSFHTEEIKKASASTPCSPAILIHENGSDIVKNTLTQFDKLFNSISPDLTTGATLESLGNSVAVVVDCSNKVQASSLYSKLRSERDR